MAISFTRYVNILSSVGGTPAVRTRELIARWFTVNPLVPTNTLIEFTTAAEVGDYFGTDSEIYKRAFFYFGWISKKNTRASKLGVARWANADTAAQIYGAKGTYTLAQFTGITAGAFTFHLNGANHTIAATNLSAAGSLAAVAAAIQAAMRTVLLPLVAPLTVVFDATRGSFNFDGHDTTGDPNPISITDGAQTLAAALGWTTGAILSDGVQAQSITDILTASVTASNNFGSFNFTDDADMTLDDVTEAAVWNAAQNVDFQYSQSVAAADASTWSAALINTAGVELTLQGPAGEWHELCPEVLLASTPYNRRNAVRNYMFQQFPQLTPTVGNDTDADLYDGLRINYLGVTQEAGNLLAFYQRGVMMGNSTAPVDMNVYANEQWLKDAAAAALMNLFVAVDEVPANPNGRATLIATLMGVIDSSAPDGVGAVQNGVISVGKTLTQLQITVISEDSGDADAWRQVQTIGYWLDVEFEQEETDDDRVETNAIYTLIYAKDDVVRKVTGSHILI